MFEGEAKVGFAVKNCIWRVLAGEKQFAAFVEMKGIV